MAKRDIDQIITLLTSQFPAIEVEQLKVSHPGADDDGIWFFKHPSSATEVQLESSFGMCPFIFEGAGPARDAPTIDAAVAMVAAGLSLASQQPYR